MYHDLKKNFKWFSASCRFKAQQQRWSETFKVLGSNKRPTKHLKDLNHLKLLRFISHFVFSLGERILLSSHFLKLYDCQKSFEANFLVFIHPKVFKYWMSEKVIGKDKAGFLGPSEKFGFVSCLGPSPERPKGFTSFIYYFSGRCLINNKGPSTFDFHIF